MLREANISIAVKGSENQNFKSRRTEKNKSYCVTHYCRHYSAKKGAFTSGYYKLILKLLTLKLRHYIK